MPPRLRLRSLADLKQIQSSVCTCCSYATATASAAVSNATNPTSTIPIGTLPPQQAAVPIPRYSAVQPPSHRSPAYRKSQLLRSYVSLLQTTPLIILFQHTNLKAVEWASIRRELATALQNVDDAEAKARGDDKETYRGIADAIKLTVIRTNIFEPALRITEFYKPTVAATSPTVTIEDGSRGHGIPNETLDPSLTHALSTAAHDVARAHIGQHPLSPLLTGPLAILTFPSVSPAHVKAALSILSPQPGRFPAPTRRLAPGYYAPATQDGLKKLMMLGARVDGRVFDAEGVRWVGSIDGGIDGLRAQLVGMLQGFAAGITTTLESASRNLWFTVEGRRRMLEEAQDSASKVGEGEAEKKGE